METYDWKTDLLNAVKSYGNGLVGLAAHERDRSEQLADLAEQRDYTDKQAERMEQRQLKREQERERLRIINEYAKAGVDVNENDTIESANKKFRKQQQMRGEKILGHFSTQLEKNAEERRERAERLIKSSIVTGNAEVNRMALIRTLADPAVANLVPKAQKDKLNKALTSGGDPSKVVQEVFNYMSKDYWFRSGAAAQRAGAFYERYLDDIRENGGKAQATEAAVLMQELKSLEQVGENIALQRDRHVAEWSPWLSAKAINGAAKRTGFVPRDPNTVLNGLKPPGGAAGGGTTGAGGAAPGTPGAAAGAGGASAPGGAATEPAKTTTEDPDKPSIIDEKGVVGGLGSLLYDGVVGFGNLLDKGGEYVRDYVKGPDGLRNPLQEDLFGKVTSTPPVTRADAMANRLRLNAALAGQAGARIIPGLPPVQPDPTMPVLSSPPMTPSMALNGGFVPPPDTRGLPAPIPPRVVVDPGGAINLVPRGSEGPPTPPSVPVLSEGSVRVIPPIPKPTLASPPMTPTMALSGGFTPQRDTRGLPIPTAPQVVVDPGGAVNLYPRSQATPAAPNIPVLREGTALEPLIVPTEDEKIAMERLARNLGMTEERIAAAEENLRKGDPEAIRVHNQILQIVRQSGLAVPEPSTSFPANAPILP